MKTGKIVKVAEKKIELNVSDTEQFGIFMFQFFTVMPKTLFVLLLLFFATPTLAQNYEDTASTNALYNKILNLDETIRNNPNRQADVPRITATP